MQRIANEVPRHGVSVAKEVLADTPLLVVQGARQVGKSTLLQQATRGMRAHHVTLDNPTALSAAQADPVGFISQEPGRLLVVDEAQRAPGLALALKEAIDIDRRPGRFAITGSADLLSLPGIADSLAGRAESIRVHTLSQGEIEQRATPEDWVAWILDLVDGAHKLPQTVQPREETREAILRGGYPEPLKRSTNRAADRWFASYSERLALHDAKHLEGKGQFSSVLEPLLRILASEGSAELVKAKIARQLGIAESTLTDHLALAKAMYLIDELPAWGRAFSTRAVRRPKIAVSDTGFASSLSGFTVEKSRLVGGMEHFGALVEAFAAGELRKQQEWSRERYRLYHYRERTEEVDIVIELADGRLILVEVKAAVGVDKRAWRHLESLSEKLEDRVVVSVVLFLGDQALTAKHAHGTVYLLPVSTLWRHPEGSGLPISPERLFSRSNVL